MLVHLKKISGIGGQYSCLEHYVLPSLINEGLMKDLFLILILVSNSSINVTKLLCWHKNIV